MKYYDKETPEGEKLMGLLKLIKNLSDEDLAQLIESVDLPKAVIQSALLGVLSTRKTKTK